MAYNPDQPREPAGDENGGRWTAIGKRGGKYEAKYFSPYDNGDIIPEEIADVFYNSNTGAAVLYGQAESMEEGLSILIGKDGKPKAFFSGGVNEVFETKEDLGDQVYQLMFLGAADDAPGWGARAFAEACRIASQDYEATALQLSSYSSLSDAFYEAIGMHRLAPMPGDKPDAMNKYWLNKSEMDSIVENYFSER